MSSVVSLPAIPEDAKLPDLARIPADADLEAFLRERKISPETLDKAGVIYTVQYIAGLNQKCLAFPFASPISGMTYGYKFRAVSGKTFSASSGRNSPKSLWGDETIKKGDTVYIVEGEMDRLAMIQAGFVAVSVPNGAPNKLSDEASFRAVDDNKLNYLKHSQAALALAEKIVIATDADAPGQILAEEIARRCGKNRVSRVLWSGGKDANDILMLRDEAELRRQASAIQPWPMSGVKVVSEYQDDVENLWNDGAPRGFSIGFRAMDPLFKMAMKQLILVTGYPGSGKSEFVDSIALFLAASQGIKTCYASFENPANLHIAKLAEKRIGKPFFEGRTQRMSKEELREQIAFLGQHIAMIDLTDGTRPTIDLILDRASVAVQRLGCRLLVIDPWNYVCTDDSDGWSPDRISEALTKMRLFAEAHDASVILVAHPQKLMRVGNEPPVPTGMDISGAMAFYAKADAGITVHRQPDSTLVRVWKQRWRYFGKTGDAHLDYDPVCGRFSDQETDFGLPDFDDGWHPASQRHPLRLVSNNETLESAWQDIPDPVELAPVRQHELSDFEREAIERQARAMAEGEAQADIIRQRRPPISALGD